MKTVRFFGLAILLVMAPVGVSYAQEPEQSAQTELPAGLSHWRDILQILVGQVTTSNAAYRVPDNAEHAARLVQQAAASRLELEQQIAAVRTALDQDREANESTLTIQRRTLQRLEFLAVFVENARLSTMGGDRTSNRQALLLTFREVNLLHASMAESLDEFLEQGSFERVWNRAFELNSRVDALDLEVQLSVLRGEADIASAQAAMSALAQDARSLASQFATANQLAADQRAVLSDIALRHANDLETYAAGWSDLTSARVLESVDFPTPNLIEDLAEAVAPPALRL